MSQQMNILRCSACKAYQVHLTKNAKKWQCKICDFKQTFKQVYFKGSGKDCRIFVQKLNISREHDNEQSTSCGKYNNVIDNSFHHSPEQKELKLTEGKWAKYLNTSEEIQFNSFNGSHIQSTSHKNIKDSAGIHNKNAMLDCPRNEETSIDPDSCYQNGVEETCDYNSEDENGTKRIKEALGDLECNDNGQNNDNLKINIIESECVQSIFDDNEDFDLAIDF